VQKYHTTSFACEHAAIVTFRKTLLHRSHLNKLKLCNVLFVVDKQPVGR